MSTYRHSIRDLWDWTRPLAEHPLPPLGTGPLEPEKIKRRVRDELDDKQARILRDNGFI